VSLTDFEIHLVHSAPAFRCYACGDEDEKLDFIARVQHRINPPAETQALAVIDRLLNHVGASFGDFYGKHDGLVMYEDTNDTQWSGGRYRVAGLAFFCLADWQSKSDQMRKDLIDMGYEEEDMPSWFAKGVAFAEIPGSGNYFVVQGPGEDEGKIFYADHDAFDSDPVALSFEEFLSYIIANPADFLYQFGCYTRYSDGNSKTQWIPKEYVAGPIG
jgi:hypothetical protein